MGTPRLHIYEKRGQALPPHGASVRAAGTSASRGVAIYIEARPLLLEASAYAVTGNLEGGGLMGIVHPTSDDEGTERTWLEPKQRPRRTRPVHGKQSP